MVSRLSPLTLAQTRRCAGVGGGENGCTISAVTTIRQLHVCHRGDCRRDTVPPGYCRPVRRRGAVLSVRPGGSCFGLVRRAQTRSPVDAAGGGPGNLPLGGPVASRTQRSSLYRPVR